MKKQLEQRDIVYIFLFLSPVMILGIRTVDIIEVIVPDGGDLHNRDRIPFYRDLLDLSSRQHIRFSLKAGNDAFLLFSERHANTIDYGTDLDYAEIHIGGSGNSKTVITIGTMSGMDGFVYTPDILDGTLFQSFWVSWDFFVIKFGYGFVIGQDVITEKPYPATTDMKYMAVCNARGSDGMWKLYACCVHNSCHKPGPFINVRPPWGSVKLISTKLTNLASLK